MKHITFFGAAGTVTGSNFLITDNHDYGMMVDMGMFQGKHDVSELNYDPLQFDAQDVHTVLLTHAHLDHCGRLPMLMRNNFRGKIYATEATKKLTLLVLLDSAKINERETDKPLLYTEEDVEKLMDHFEIVSYNKPFHIDEYEILYKNAGHILGSASIEIKDTKNNKRITFSGDLGNTPEDIVQPTEYFDGGDFVVMESTYGGRTHPNEHPEEVIQKEINTIEGEGSTLLIPSFSLERTQVILHVIDQFKKQNKVKNETKVFLDSPMGERATKIYSQFSDLYNESLAQQAKIDDPFSFPGLKVIENSKESGGIKNINGPKVIIAGSGMMNGGRIANHAIDFLPLKSTRLLIVGFQAEGTPGRAVEEGQKKVKFYDTEVTINATITSLHSMSAHADDPKLITWLKHIKGVREVFLVHGEDDGRNAIEKEIKEQNICQTIHKPYINQQFELNML